MSKYNSNIYGLHKDKLSYKYVSVVYQQQCPIKLYWNKRNNLKSKPRL